MLGAIADALSSGISRLRTSTAYGHFHFVLGGGDSLTTGGSDPLLPLLGEHIDKATSVDLAVAFAMDSGVSLLEPWLRELLDRGGRLRIIVGDYLDTTDPAALRRLLDFDGAELFIFETRGLSFHPKAWLFRASDGDGMAVVGSSNLSQSALVGGVEWNLHSEAATDHVAAAFEELLAHPQVSPLTEEWVENYAQRRRTQPLPEFSRKVVEVEGPPPDPHPIQLEALDALNQTRGAGHRAGLVVLGHRPWQDLAWPPSTPSVPRPVGFCSWRIGTRS